MVKMLQKAFKIRLTQAEVVDCVSDGVDLQILPIAAAGESERSRQEATAGERLIHALSIDLQARKLVHWHVLT